MHGKGTFFDSRLDDAAQFPIAARAGFGHTEASPDLVSPKLPALQAYELSLTAPAAPHDSFNKAAAERGKEVFDTAGKCATCHVAPTYTEPGWNLHTAAEVGVDDFQANRSPDKRYRTTPLKGLWTHSKGGYYHDGRFATLADVIKHYDSLMSLGLSAQQKGDLAEYLKSL
jgi:cytochrome c peroxidase